MSAPAYPLARAQLAHLAEMVRGASSVVALTGAGISVPSGIPDFRSPGTGMWERVDPMEVAHIDAFRSDPVRFWRFYGERFATLEDKQPNGAHRALVELERAGLLDGVVTQNVDMLHRRAGTHELVEVHGSIATCSCARCGGGVALAEARALMREDEQGVPRCQSCLGALKPDVVLFGEHLRAPSWNGRSACARARTCFCASAPRWRCTPWPALPRLTLETGGAVAIITQGPTPLDGLAEVRLTATSCSSWAGCWPRWGSSPPARPTRRAAPRGAPLRRG